jgi:hypothetical protein
MDLQLVYLIFITNILKQASFVKYYFLLSYLVILISYK